MANPHASNQYAGSDIVAEPIRSLMLTLQSASQPRGMHQRLMHDQESYIKG
jgi:hypothetical protein